MAEADIEKELKLADEEKEKERQLEELILYEKEEEKRRKELEKTKVEQNVTPKVEENMTPIVGENVTDEKEPRFIPIDPKSPPPSGEPICASCCEPVRGPCITALAANADRALKFHPHHFTCSYCLAALNQHGTYREHKRKPYCHNCFYRLHSGHIYEVN